MAAAMDFIHSFNTLDGVTIREKKKSLHQLLNRYKNANSDLLDEIIPQLKPSNYLEETFKFEVLLYFRRTNDLLNSLKFGDEIRASKVIRQNWFIQGLLEKFAADEIARELFPKLSFSTRIKLLKRILIYSKNESKTDAIFEQIRDTYGFKIALILLPGCSSEKIENVMKNNIVNLSVSQLKLIFDKDRKLVEFYMKQIKENTGYVGYKWEALFDYIAIKDPVYQVQLCKDLGMHQRKFGRSTTKKFVDSKKDQIIEKPEEFARYLRGDALVRKLGNDFTKFYENGLPENIDNFSYKNSSVQNLLKYYVKGKQYEFYKKSFEEKYKKNLWDHVNCMEERLIEFITNKEERSKWIKLFDNRENYFNYKPEVMMRCCSTSMKMQFDEDFSAGPTAIADRKTVFNTLINTCKLDQNYDALTNIFDLFTKRYRNSDVTILYNFLRSIYKELNMDKLTEEHWKYIYEIISIQIFKKQQTFHQIFVEYIKFLHVKQQKPIEEIVLVFLKQLPQDLMEIKYENDEFEKLMLKLYIKLLPQIDDKKNSLLPQILLGIQKWNEKHREDIISVNDHSYISNFFTQLKDIEKNADKKTLNAFKYLICTQNGDMKEESELDQIYWTNFKNLRDKTVTKWYTKYKPEIVRKNIEKVGMMLQDENVVLARNLLKYDHLNIPKTITELCLKELETAEPSKRERVVKILLTYMTSDDFLKYFKEHVPKSEKIDVNSGNEELMKLYEVQCALAKHSRLRIDNLSKYLPTLLEYCKGEVLASALSSLYSFFCRIPENELTESLEVLSNKAVSVRKHSIYLSSIILPTDEVLKKYKKVQSTEKNETVKQYMFLNCYLYFTRNHSDDCWEIIENYLRNVKKDQKDVLKLLANVHEIPKSHRGAYIETAWSILDKFKTKNTKIDENMHALLRNLKKDDMGLLKHEFCMGIIQDKLFDLDECSMNDNVMSFTKRFLFYKDGNEEGKLNFIFKCLRIFKEKFWDNNEKKFDALKTVNNFCFSIFVTFCEDKKEKFDKNTCIPKVFAELWRKEFIFYETFEENLLIDFVTIKLESSDDTESFSKAMNTLFCNNVEKYGNLIVPNLSRFFNTFLRRIWGEHSDDYNKKILTFLESYLEIDSTDEHYALVVELLPSHSYFGEEKEIRERILTKLLSKNEIVKVLVYGTFKSSSYY